jgi:rhodanese-related sulfurtransferase
LPKIIHDNKHIPGSINIPVSEILTSPLMPTEKDKQLIFYCMGTL